MEIRFELLPLPDYFTAPAHPHTTDADMYTTLFPKNDIAKIVQWYFYLYHRR